MEQHLGAAAVQEVRVVREGRKVSVCLSVCLGSLPLVLSASRFRYMAGSLRRRSDARTGGVLAVLCAYSSGARRQLRGSVAS